MKHLPKNIKIMKEITDYLKSQNKQYKLWEWAIKVPMEHRIEQLLFHNRFLKKAYEDDKKIIKNGIVLDLGCGFCPYWPFLHQLGYNKFVGFDLYTKRGFGPQEYMKTAAKIVNHFCPSSDFIIIEDDVRNILNYKNRSAENMFSNAMQKGNIDFIKDKNFDLIFTKNTNYKKVGSTGIPPNIFEEICGEFLKDDGIKIYAG